MKTTSVFSRCLLTAGMSLVATILSAQPVALNAKLTAPDRSVGASFGHYRGISLSGSTAVVTAHQEGYDVNGMNYLNGAGAVYMSERDQSGTWHVTQKICSQLRHWCSYFGYSAWVDQNTLIVGALDSCDAVEANPLLFAGAAYIFEKDLSGMWVQAAKLVPAMRYAQAAVGTSVGIHGNVAVAGAPGECLDDNGNNYLSNAGAAYVFERDLSGNWIQVQRLVAPDRSSSQENFGTTISVYGNFLAVGCRSSTDAGGQNFLANSGAVYIYERNSTGVWDFVQKIVASDRVQMGLFCYSLQLEAHTLIVGAPGATLDETGSNYLLAAGAMYSFEMDVNGVWTQTQKITPPDRDSLDNFGTSVALSGDLAVAGATWDDETPLSATDIPNAGSAYAYVRGPSGTWSLLSEINAFDRDTADTFGFSVGAFGETIMVGTSNEDEDSLSLNTKTGAGAVYIYDADVPLTSWLPDEEQSCRLFPVPAGNVCTVDLSAIKGNVHVTIVDEAGRIHYQQVTQGGVLFPIDLSELPPGSYLVTVSGNEKRFTKKMVHL